MFEDMQPAAILAQRGTPAALAAAPPAEGEPPHEPLEYLVRWGDGSADSWEPERNVADDVIADFESGLQFALATAVLAQRRAGRGNEFLLAWEDGAEPSWQEEAQVADELLLSWLDKQGAPRRKRQPKAAEVEKPAEAEAEAEAGAEARSEQVAR